MRIRRGKSPAAAAERHAAFSIERDIRRRLQRRIIKVEIIRRGRGGDCPEVTLRRNGQDTTIEVDIAGESIGGGEDKFARACLDEMDRQAVVSERHRDCQHAGPTLLHDDFLGRVRGDRSTHGDGADGVAVAADKEKTARIQRQLLATEIERLIALSGVNLQRVGSEAIDRSRRTTAGQQGVLHRGVSAIGDKATVTRVGVDAGTRIRDRPIHAADGGPSAKDASDISIRDDETIGRAGDATRSNV